MMAMLDKIARSEYILYITVIILLAFLYTNFNTTVTTGLVIMLIAIISIWIFDTNYFKESMKKAGFTFAADSSHPIQPVLIGDPVKTRALVDFLFSKDFLVTNISYPVVPKGADEIRVQLSSSHQKKDIDALIAAFKDAP